MENNETTKVKEVKGFKKGIKFFTVILAISIITSILGIISCITEGSVEVWQHVILWLTLLLEDDTENVKPHLIIIYYII